jgi:hypothetical protein
MKKIFIVFFILAGMSNSYALQFPSSFQKKQALNEYSQIADALEIYNSNYKYLSEIVDCGILEGGNGKYKPIWLRNKNNKRFVLKCLGDVKNWREIYFMIEMQEWLFNHHHLSPFIYLTSHRELYAIFNAKIYVLNSFVPGKHYLHDKKSNIAMVKRMSWLAAIAQNSFRLKSLAKKLNFKNPFIYSRFYKSRVDVLRPHMVIIFKNNFLWEQFVKFLLNFGMVKKKLLIRPIINDLHYLNVIITPADTYKIVDFDHAQIDYRILEFMNIILSTPAKEPYHYTFSGLLMSVITYNRYVVDKLNRYEVAGIIEMLRSRFLQDIANYMKNKNYRRLDESLPVFKAFVKDWRILNFRHVYSAN